MSAGLTDKSGDEARQNMQVKSFKAWVNMHLGKEREAKLEVDDLSKDFTDGIRLLRLVEIISEEELGKYNKKPISKFQKVENLNIPLKFINSFLKDIGIKNSYSAENILEENVTLILGMVWSLILRFNVSEIEEGDQTAKEGLLLWAKNKVAEVTGGTKVITNFHTNWQDGVAFNALIQAYRPDLTNYNSLDPNDKKANLVKAFDIAEQQLGIGRLLDADDMVSVMRPDEKSVMTYVSLFWKEFAANKRKRLAGERIAQVAQREMSNAEMEASYAASASSLAKWMQEKTAALLAGPNCNSQSELEIVLQAQQEYGRTERPAKQQELLDLEALSSSLASRLATLGRSFEPPPEISLASLQRWWEELTQAEHKYTEQLKEQLQNLKKVELYIKLFNSKAGKLEDWFDAKEAWLQAWADKLSDAPAAEEPQAEREGL